MWRNTPRLETQGMRTLVVLAAVGLLLGGMAALNRAPEYAPDHGDPLAQQAGGLVPPLQISGLRPPLPLENGEKPGGAPGGFFLPGLDFAHGPGALFHPHGEKVCASGCAASSHPTQQLTADHFDRLMGQFARQPIAHTSPAFEELLYFGRQTRKRIEDAGFAPLDADRAAALWRELGRTKARVSVRLVDEADRVRAWLEPTLVPLDRRHVFELHTNQLQPLIVSGTVKRVGLDHLWTRL